MLKLLSTFSHSMKLQFHYKFPTITVVFHSRIPIKICQKWKLPVNLSHFLVTIIIKRWNEQNFVNQGERWPLSSHNSRTVFKLLLRNWSYNYITHTQHKSTSQISFTIKMWFLAFFSFLFKRRQMLVSVNTLIVWLQLTELYCPFYLTSAE